MRNSIVLAEATFPDSQHKLELTLEPLSNYAGTRLGPVLRLVALEHTPAYTFAGDEHPECYHCVCSEYFAPRHVRKALEAFDIRLESNSFCWSGEDASKSVTDILGVDREPHTYEVYYHNSEHVNTLRVPEDHTAYSAKEEILSQLKTGGMVSWIKVIDRSDAKLIDRVTSV